MRLGVMVLKASPSKVKNMLTPEHGIHISLPYILSSDIYNHRLLMTSVILRVRPPTYSDTSLPSSRYSLQPSREACISSYLSNFHM